MRMRKIGVDHNTKCILSCDLVDDHFMCYLPRVMGSYLPRVTCH